MALPYEHKLHGRTTIGLKKALKDLFSVELFSEALQCLVCPSADLKPFLPGLNDLGG